MKPLTRILACLIFAGLSVCANATLYIHEDFEDATPLENLGFPLQPLGNGTMPDAAQMARRGINLRGHSDQGIWNPGGSPAEYNDVDPPLSLTATGSVTKERMFLGAQSYKLDSGEKIATNEFAHRFWGWSKDYQFAIAVDGASLQPTGTKIGHFKIEWYCPPADPPLAVFTGTEPVNATFELELIMSGPNAVNVVCANNGAVVGTLTGDVSNWLLLSILEVTKTDDPDFDYYNWDPVMLVAKGPIPNDLVGEPDATTFTSLDGGMHVYVGSKRNAATIVPAATLNPLWGNYGDQATQSRPYLIRWEIAAENGGALYVDNLFWNLAGHQNAGTRGHESEVSQRMLPFDQATTEVFQGAAARDWELY